MRPLLLILATVLLIGVVFGIYMASQQKQVPPPVALDDPTAQRTVPTQPIGSQQELHSGQDAFFQVFDKESGELTSQYRAHHYAPQPDGSWLLDTPEADFFLDDG